MVIFIILILINLDMENAMNIKFEPVDMGPEQLELHQSRTRIQQQSCGQSDQPGQKFGIETGETLRDKSSIQLRCIFNF